MRSIDSLSHNHHSSAHLMGAMRTSSIAIRAETLCTPPPPVLTRSHHLCNCSRTLKATAAAATSSTTAQWWGRRRTEEALPPLLQRPHRPSPTNEHLHLLLPEPHETISNNHKDGDEEEEEEENCSRGVTATATDVLRLMDSLRLPVETDIYISLVKECTDAKDAEQGAKVHAHIHNCSDLLVRPVGILLANRLLLMYAVCGQPENARDLFEEMPVRDSISWATMIATLSDSGCPRNALELFVDGLWSGELSGCCFMAAITALLRSCHRTGELGFGQQVHGLTIKTALDGEDYSQLGSPLIQFYTTLGQYRSAQKVFDRTLSHDAAAWACMITACCRDGGFEEAFYTFREMGQAGGRKNCYTFSSILPACAKMDDDGCSGSQVHGHAIKLGVDFNPFVGSSLVDMYAKFGLLRDARRAFQTTISSNGIGDTMCWNAMFSGYAQRGFCTEAIRLLYEMKAAGIEPHELMLDQVRKLVVADL